MFKTISFKFYWTPFVRIVRVVLVRLANPLLHFKFLYRLTNLYQEEKAHWKIIRNFTSCVSIFRFIFIFVRKMLKNALWKCFKFSTISKCLQFSGSVFTIFKFANKMLLNYPKIWKTSSNFFVSKKIISLNNCRLMGFEGSGANFKNAQNRSFAQITLLK